MHCAMFYVGANLVEGQGQNQNQGAFRLSAPPKNGDQGSLAGATQLTIFNTIVTNVFPSIAQVNIR